jgi:hypothetical protein
MAEKLDNYLFARGGATNGGSRYDDWLDGQIYRLTVPVDITNTGSAISMLRKRARLKGLKVRTRVESPAALVVQAYQGVWADPDLVA